jgi:hypothetical protein
MSPETSQDIFFEWLNAALQDSQWRLFIAARLRESELPVIDIAAKPGAPGKLRRPPSTRKRLNIEQDREEPVIAFT